MLICKEKAEAGDGNEGDGKTSALLPLLCPRTFRSTPTTYNTDEAQNIANQTGQKYPHGLAPPMKNARRRR
jgi:TATA-binding protein-associated factor Taf7